ncbi:MAG: PilZ domain-containing protein [Myxococcota bacterium]
MANQPDEQIPATLKFESGKSTSGVIVNLTGRGFVLVCDSLRNADSVLGAQVTIEASGPSIDGEQGAPGHIQGVRKEDSGHHRVSVWLDNGDDLDRMVEAGVGASFNRRGAYRVAPASNSAVRVALSSVDGSFTHKDSVSDLSASGVGVIVDEATAKAIESAFELKLAISLPGPGEALHFVSHVRRVIPKGHGHLVGLDFDPTNTPNFDERIDDVITYIMRRQREILREQKNAEG